MMLRWAVLAAIFVWTASGHSAQSAGVCTISDIASLHDCFKNTAAHEQYVFTSDVSCTREQDCCGPDGRALMTLNDMAGRVIDGQGHTIKRSAGQKSCAALTVRRGHDTAIQNLTFDEDAATPPCELAEKDCPPTLDFTTTQGVTLDHVKVRWGKGYVVKVWNVQTFAMRNSEISDAGIIGLYVGHFRYGPSGEITLESSIFARSRTNGVAIQGADNVIVRNSLFVNNHWHGLWPVPSVPGGATSGGQLLIAQGDRVNVTGNTISGDKCKNCRPPQLVAAIELGEDPMTPGSHVISISKNILCNTTSGVAIGKNPKTDVSGVTLIENRFIGFTVLDNLVGSVSRAGNTADRSGSLTCR